MRCDDPDCTTCVVIKHMEDARDKGISIEQMIFETLELIGQVYDMDVIAGGMTEYDADRGTLH